MNTIELTEEQRRVVEAGLGQPVTVIDPATQRTYVLLACGAEPGNLPVPAAPPADESTPPAYQGSPPRFRLRELPTPSAVAEEVERCWQREGGWWAGQRRRRELEDELKMQYYFGGQDVYVLRSPDGPVVVPIPETHRETEGLRYLFFTPEERTRVYSTVPSPWRDTVAQILI